MSYKLLPENWENFLIIEQELNNTFRYVAFDSEHFDVYSEEYSRIILISCVMIENIIADMANKINPGHRYTNLPSYFPCISGRFPKFTTIEITLPQYNYNLKPWENWSAQSCPEWWTMGYNKIKHDRVNNLTAPSLKRAIEAVSGLHALLLYSYRLKYSDFAIPFQFGPRLIHVVEKESDFIESAITISWKLPDD